MAINEKELNEERNYLSETENTIKDHISEIGQNLYVQEEKVVEFKKYLWDNKHGMDPVEISAAILENDLEVELLTMRGHYLKKLLKSQAAPYFGRIDFQGEKIYIGITYVDKDNDHIVYDWRSPISSMFYDAGVGEASYMAPEGLIKGNITKRRQYKIEDEKLIRVFDSDVNVVDEMLQEVLESESSDKMKNIVNTIQQEQNQIIRDIIHKNLIVQGIAGSGKTSVALHRIAFLLYKIDRLKSNEILILSPNNVFSEYISNVLPELGEDNTKNTTWSDFASFYINEYKEVESFTHFVERFYKNNNKDKMPRIKLDDNFKSLIDEYVRSLENNIHFVDGIECQHKDYSMEDLNYLLKVRYSSIPLFSRIENISEVIANYNDGGKNKKKYIEVYLLVISLNLNLEI